MLDKAMDEQTLIQRVQDGNVEAYGPLMDLHVRRLRAILALNAPAAHLIDEIAHEAFVFAFRNIHEFQRGTSFFAWLKTIAWNILRAEVQRFSREQANQSKYAERRVTETVGERTPDGCERELSGLESCMRDVPPKMRELLAMRYTFAFSTKEIAERAGHSAAWVRTTLFRLRRQLKECVQKKLATERPS
jgi:RNA polymerase sigma-70 factor (ECF subfamily)